MYTYIYIYIYTCICTYAELLMRVRNVIRSVLVKTCWHTWYNM